jgi:hypothetical protein
VTGINIPIHTIPDYLKDPPQAIPPVVPVTQTVGIPIVDMPGCVEAHEANNKSNKVGVDDENGLVTYCDAGVPSYAPINYNPDDMEFKYEQKVPPVRPPEAPEVPETPEVPATPAATAKVDCPTPAQEAKEPVGTMVEGFRKKVVAYELVGKECIQRTEKVPLPQQIVAGLPSGGQVVQVGGVAVIATTSALLAKPLADLLLKVVKPTIKKVMKKIAAIRGKQVRIESLEERRGQQRIRNKAIRVLKGRG